MAAAGIDLQRLFSYNDIVYFDRDRHVGGELLQWIMIKDSRVYNYGHRYTEKGYGYRLW